MITRFLALQLPLLIQGFYPEAYEIGLGRKVKGSFEILNRTEDEQIIDAWLEVYTRKGQGGPIGKLISRDHILIQETLSPQATRVVEGFRLTIPEKQRKYTILLRVSNHSNTTDAVMDTRWFTVKVK